VCRIGHNRHIPSLPIYRDGRGYRGLENFPEGVGVLQRLGPRRTPAPIKDRGYTSNRPPVPPKYVGNQH
jgi:hypothetical protein